MSQALLRAAGIDPDEECRPRPDEDGLKADADEQGDDMSEAEEARKELREQLLDVFEVES